MNPLEDSLWAIVQRANGGDIEAALEVLQSSVGLLATVDSYGTPMNRHPNTGEPIQIPAYLRDYLAIAIWKIAFKNIDANKAFGLSKKGQRPIRRHHRELAAEMARQLIEQGRTIRGAAQDVAIFIAGMNQTDAPYVWRGFAGTRHSAAQIQKWYFEMYPATLNRRRNLRK